MPSFLTPDFGLLFWMLIAFLVVFVVLAKYGFPVITGMVEKRKQYIDESLINARLANEKIANIKTECKAMLREAQARQSEILKDATETRNKIISDAKLKAQEEASRIIEDARLQIQSETEKAQRELRSHIVDLSVKIAEKVLLRNLQEKEEQMQWIDQVLDKMSKD